MQVENESPYHNLDTTNEDFELSTSLIGLEQSNQRLDRTFMTSSANILPSSMQKLTEEDMEEIQQHVESQKFFLNVTLHKAFINTSPDQRYDMPGDRWTLLPSREDEVHVPVKLILASRNNVDTESIGLRFVTSTQLDEINSKYLCPSPSSPSSEVICPYGIVPITVHNSKDFTGKRLLQYIEDHELHLRLDFTFNHGFEVPAHAITDITASLADWLAKYKDEQIKIKENSRGKNKLHNKFLASKEIRLDILPGYTDLADDQFGYAILTLELTTSDHKKHPQKQSTSIEPFLTLFDDRCAKDVAKHLFDNFKDKDNVIGQDYDDKNRVQCLYSDLKTYLNSSTDPLVFDVVADLYIRMSSNPLTNCLEMVKYTKKHLMESKSQKDYELYNDWLAENRKCEDRFITYLDQLKSVPETKDEKKSKILDSLFKKSLRFRSSRPLAHPLFQKLLADKWKQPVGLEKDQPEMWSFLFSPRASFVFNIISYIVFLILLTYPFIMDDGRERNILVYKYISNQILTGDYDYSEIESVETYWEWVINKLIPNLFPSDESKIYLQLIGNPTIRQYRTLLQNCTYTPPEKYPYMCNFPHPLLSTDWQTKDPSNISTWNPKGKVYTTMFLPIVYPAGSLEVSLSLNQTNFTKTMELLQNNSWLDGSTRAVQLTMLVYSANTDVIAYIQLQTAFSIQGATIPSTHWFFVSGADLDSPGGPLMVRIFQLIFIVSYIAVKIRDFLVSDKTSFWADTWNIVDVIWVIALLATSLSSFTKDYKMHPYQLSNDKFGDIWSFLFWREFAQGLILAFSYYRLVYYTRVFRSTGILMSTLGTIARDIVLFVIITFCISLGFAFILFALYEGTEFLDFRNFGSTVLILMKSIPGNYPFHTQADEIGGKSGRIFVASSVEGTYLLMSILCVNILIAMLSWTYNRISEEAVERWSFQFAHVIQSLKGTTWPPPFNIPGYIYHYFKSSKQEKKRKRNGCYKRK